ncbi:alpha/beta hydrolase [Sphaerisporangium rufum]|uniref:Alpha/beta hydrolase n=1 Tax=Sphaerisporangium rufum TaxID=1381558 RepID=A0A919R3D0_9ACTN|nr:alpha/beta fold hydrolase [Sphaerisporangium rufum]GII78954.1 alpha/beta hydrolase [Sphaerisporangium rufum]
MDVTKQAGINGITVTYEDEGTGPALLLVHGHPFDRSMWAPQVAEFAASGYRVIVPDLRGYGQSTVVPGTTPFPVFAADLAALLDHLGVAGVVVGGLSMGGQIAMEFCRRHPGRMRGLLLADTSAPAETPEGREARYVMAERLLAEGMGPYAEEVLGMMVAPATVTGRPQVARHVLAMMRAAPPAGAAAALRGRAERDDHTATLAGLTVPATVVVGREDAYTPVADAEFMARTIPDADLVVVDGAGHLPNLERPEEFDRALRGLLARSGHPAPARR